MSFLTITARFIDTFAQPKPESLRNSEWNKSENLFYDDDDCIQPNGKRIEKEKISSRDEKEFLTK